LKESDTIPEKIRRRNVVSRTAHENWDCQVSKTFGHSTESKETKERRTRKVGEL